jgi:ATP-dependent Clp protease adapter protein ClpS
MVHQRMFHCCMIVIVCIQCITLLQIPVIESFTIPTSNTQLNLPIRTTKPVRQDPNSFDNGLRIVQQQPIDHSYMNKQSYNNRYTQLYMSSTEKITTKTTKKGTQVMDKTETKVEEKKNKEEMWRVVLHNDEVHTFNYVVRSLTKVIGILDRKAAFEICVQTHGIGKATITKTWKKQAEQFCLGLQRQGLTVSISPDEDFEGGHSGGGL